MRRGTGLVLLAGLASGATAHAQDGEGSSAALQVLEALQAAQAARAERVEIEAAAQAEAARLAAQVAEAEAKAELARVRARRTRERLEALRSEAGPLDEREARLGGLMEQVASRVNDALDRLDARLLPGIVPPAREPAPTRFEDRYEAALDRLEQAERRLDQIEVMVVESRLEGEPAAVEVLRFGGASAWWRAFDGERFGVVRVVDGEVRLEPKTGAGLAERVELAFDIAKGRAAPELVVLPLAPLTPGGPSS